MLILTRNVSETIVINEDVRVTIMSARGGQIKVGIEAPEGIPVDREEIHLKKMAERSLAGITANAPA